MGGPIWIGRIVTNTVYYQFQKQSLWVADKRIELDGIRLDAGYISVTIQWYEQITGISGSDLVFRLYCDNPPQVRIHTKFVHGKISMTKISGTPERHTYERNKNPSPLESLHGNELQ